MKRNKQTLLAGEDWVTLMILLEMNIEYEMSACS